METQQPRHGYLYQVTKELEVNFEMLQNQKTDDKSLKCYRKIIIPVGEVLEFRYWSPAHFRDIYNNYFPLHDSQLDRIIEVAEIYPQVCSVNQAHLHDILRLHLYTSVKGQPYTLPIQPDLSEHFKNVYLR